MTPTRAAWLVPLACLATSVVFGVVLGLILTPGVVLLGVIVACVSFVLFVGGGIFMWRRDVRRGTIATHKSTSTMEAEGWTLRRQGVLSVPLVALATVTLLITFDVFQDPVVAWGLYVTGLLCALTAFRIWRTGRGTRLKSSKPINTPFFGRATESLLGFACQATMPISPKHPQAGDCHGAQALTLGALDRFRPPPASKQNALPSLQALQGRPVVPAPGRIAAAAATTRVRQRFSTASPCSCCNRWSSTASAPVASRPAAGSRCWRS